MAKKKKNTGNITSSTETNSFLKGMNKDVNSSFQPKESWFHAINAYNNSADGDAGVIGNEPANLQCAEVPYPIIGAVHKEGDRWFIFSTDDVSSEIGLLDDSKCEYTTIVNAQCLNFNRKYLITGASKENYDCTWQVYWDDNLNPSRTLNVDNIPWIQVEVQPPGSTCIEYADTTELNCEKVRLAPLMQTPCLELTKDIDGGLIRNGSYQAYIAYVVNEQRVTDYIGISNIQSLFIHEDVGGSLNVKLTNLDQSFEYYELAILSNTKEQVVAKKVGIYSTEQNSISLDFIDPALISIPLEQLFGRSPAYEKSESMYVVNDYLIRQGPTEQFDFNYQPLANQIETKWQVAQYPSDYYHKGGNKTSFMRDEQYAFFIRWIYNTGERSASYHIPGRVAKVGGFVGNGQSISGNEIDTNQSFNSLNTDEQNWQVFNTASIGAILNIPLDDGGIIISEGEMGYWESTERYPATKPEIWNASSNPIWNSTDPAHDLCGKNIRHHKMPSEEVDPSLKLSTEDGQFIRILGVKFSNIKRPLYNDGTVIPNVVGYEIIRGSREGAKSIMAKGIFKNMRKYDIPNEENLITSNVQGLYPNYPYNDLRDDTFFHNGSGITGKRTEGLQSHPFSIADAPPLTGYTKDVFTFHTPELPFRKPYLNAYETRIYGKYKGEATGYFTKSEDHPGEKLLMNYPIVYAAILGIGYALTKFKGKKNQKNLPLRFVHHNPDFVNDVSTGQSGTNGTIGGAATAVFGSLTAGSLNRDMGRPLRQPGPQVTSGAGAFALGGSIGPNAVANTVLELVLESFTDLGDIVTGGLVSQGEQTTLNESTYGRIAAVGGTEGGGMEIEYEGSDWKSLPDILRGIMAIPGFLVYTAEGANVFIDLFYNLMSYQDYALKHNSHGFYTTLDPLSGTQFRSRNIASNYLGSSFSIFGEASNQLYKINNLFRPDTIAINTNNEFQDPEPDVDDLSRYSLGQLEADDLLPAIHKSYQGAKFKKPICSLYGALKFKIDNQYGQIEGIKQTPMRGCIQYIELDKDPTFGFETNAFFTGDVYINRYTEKTIMPIFTDFLYGQPDGYVYDYLKYTNIPYPRYWMNTERYDFTQIYNIFEQFGSVISGNTNQWFSILPSDLYSVDAPFELDPTTFATLNFFSGGMASLANQSLFAVTNGFIYTHINGVQDFFVESELNIAQRDWKETPDKRHYDQYLYNNVNDLFHAKIQKEDNFYLYDYSLSASRFITNLTSFGVIQPRDYDPLVAETCFTFYPKRLIYSLRAQEEAKKDFWRVFLPNNYKDFKNKVSVIKPVNQTGALMFFPYASPRIFKGVDQLQTDLGTKVILGDGGLFAREPQNITNSDLANEYASCESARSVINTPMGVFFISQAQGKIFQYSGRLDAISDRGMKWWFNKYLPSILLRQYPELEGTELDDNPVVGIGCQAVYDINDDIVYFIKKDYAVKEAFLSQVVFDSFSCQFEINVLGTKYPIKLGDPIYFDDASWTVSYDPKIKGWISFHDWKPEFVLPSINHFLTSKTFESDELKCPPTYQLINGVCQKILNETAPGFVNKEETDYITVNACPSGFILNQTTNICEGPTTSASVSPTTYTLQQINQGPQVYVCYQTRFYVGAINAAPPFTTIPTSTELFYNNTNPVAFNIRLPNTPYPAEPWHQRLRRGGVWTNLSGPAPCNEPPCGEWIGFITCIDVPESREYSLAIAGDNKVRIFIDGTLYADLNFGSDVTFKVMHVLPIFLTAGTHSIKMEGFNVDNIGGFVGEIYNLTLQEAQDPIYTGSEFVLEPYRIFSPLRDEVQFNTGETSGNTCPDGYSLVYSADCGEFICVQNEYPQETCGCLPGYTLVFPEILPSNQVIWTQPTGDCEVTILENLGGEGNGEPVDPPGGDIECPIDIAFVIQADDSTGFLSLQNPSQQDHMIAFLFQFLLNGDIQNALNSGLLQVGLVQHAKSPDNLTFPQCLSGNINYAGSINSTFDFQSNLFMSSSDVSIPGSPTPSDIASGFSSWLYNTWLGWSGIGTTWGVDYGQRAGILNVINTRATSQLGDRQLTNPNYKAFVFHITGTPNLWNGFGYPTCFSFANIARNFLSPNQFSGCQGPDWLYSIMTYIPYQPETRAPLTSSSWLSPLYGNPDHLFPMTNGTTGWNTPFDFSEDIKPIVELIQKICTPATPTVYCDCYDYTLTILDSAPLDQYDILYQNCVTGSYETQTVQKGLLNTVTIPCVREDSVSFVQSIDASQFTLTEGALCPTQYDCDSGPTAEPSIETYPAICRKLDCGCPPSSLPNATLTQIGDCDDINNLIYLVGDPDYIISPSLISCEYQALLQVLPSSERGTLWRHNYRCDLYANYYGQDYPWEVELVENTGQMVTTIRSFEYQLEAYVYKGDLIHGCGDDKWHDLDFNFDESVIYNSEQVSGLLKLNPHPKEDPLNMIIYPIINTFDIQILYSKEEQKYRFNQFWDVTADRGEFTNAEQNIFITQLNGYIKDLNFQNLLYQKPSNQRKKFRHYYNKVILRRLVSGNRKMLLKLNNTKLNLSMR